eukprot:6463273-Amphidinium_carterae.1
MEAEVWDGASARKATTSKVGAFLHNTPPCTSDAIALVQGLCSHQTMEAFFWNTLAASASLVHSCMRERV